MDALCLESKFSAFILERGLYPFFWIVSLLSHWALARYKAFHFLLNSASLVMILRLLVIRKGFFIFHFHHILCMLSSQIRLSNLCSWYPWFNNLIRSAVDSINEPITTNSRNDRQCWEVLLLQHKKDRSRVMWFLENLIIIVEVGALLFPGNKNHLSFCFCYLFWVTVSQCKERELSSCST